MVLKGSHCALLANGAILEDIETITKPIKLIEFHSVYIGVNLAMVTMGN